MRRTYGWLALLLLASFAPAAAGDEPSDALATALSLERAFIEVADRVQPGVVAIRGYVKIADGAAAAETDGWQASATDRYPGHAKRTAGSGFFVDSDGYILTTRDAVQDVDLIEVEFGRQVRIRGRVVGIEPTINLAVVKIDSPVELTPLPLADSDAVRVGQWAIALGDPDGAERTFAAGVVSLKPQRDCYQEELTRTYLQSSVRVHPQSFGGPLVDIHGRVIGVSVPRGGTATGLAATIDPGAGSAYALPSNLARTIFDALKEKESRLSPWVGISVLHLTPELRRQLGESPRTGIYIDNVFDPSPAHAAGVRVGDVLVELGGQRILAVADFQRWLYLFGIGEDVELALFRDGETRRVTVTIEQRPENATTR